MGNSETDDAQRSTSHPSTPREPKQRRTRSRIACDWCHSNHARCDRAFPCSRCLHKGTQCEFTRVRRKRGRIPKFDILEPVRPAGGKPSPKLDASSPDENSTASSAVPSVPTPEACQQGLYSTNNLTVLSPGIEDLSSLQSMPWLAQGPEAKVTAAEGLLLAQSMPSYFNDFPIPTGLGDGSFSLEPFSEVDLAGHAASENPESEVRAESSPRDITPTLRYPVLQSLMPFIKTKLSPELACGLLDLYFTSAFSTHLHPVCHHIHCYVLRKASFLDERNPRPSSPALLASMLWVASLNGNALSLPITAHYQKNICHFLGSLTIRLLKPLVHMPFDGRNDKTTNEAIYSTGFLGGLTESAPFHSVANGDTQSSECLYGPVDEVITHIHIASIISTSERKPLSMRWWQAAFTLAREHRLNREIEATPSIDSPGTFFSYTDPSFDSLFPTRKPLDCVCYRNHNSTLRVTEEHREERRRVWWLLYIMDRHLAFCYHRPLMLLDSESRDLLLPLDDEAWQAGEIHSNSPNFNGPQCIISEPRNLRRTFPDFTCHDSSVFGFFLPLMTIMGQMIGLYQIKTHPMLGSGDLGRGIWETQLREVFHQLKLYEASVNDFTPSKRVLSSSYIPTPLHDITESLQTQTHFWLTQTITSYASYYIDVLRMFQYGFWDPILLMKDRELGTSSPNFASAVPHALKTADSVRQILKFDPDINFMPELFGAQLFRGSVYLLLILKQLRDKAGEQFLSACEVMIRATESCIVTLDTGYQRNLCQILRSTVAQARGRPVNHCEIKQRQRAILALYSESGIGTGLAL
ncbi:fungal-specific transcription factor domain-containing protein [Aspergillus aurantiobrunneus]